jgi:hypothetical protein
MPSPPNAKPARTNVQCYVYDITLKYLDTLTKDAMHALFRPLCKKYIFQLEKGVETGYVHYQGRISLIKKLGKPSAQKFLLENGVKDFKISETSKEESTKDAFYCAKAATRLEKAFTDKDYVEPRENLFTVEKMEKHGLFPWQQAMLDNVAEYDDRTIHLVIEHRGRVGKSALPKYVWNNRLGEVLPPINDCNDLVQFCHNHPSKLYLIDMPRSMKKRKLHEFYAGIETLKNGYLYDKRYKGSYRYINEPNIIVFTNSPPKISYLSVDRWKFWTINSDMELEEYRYPKKWMAKEARRGKIELVEEPNEELVGIEGDADGA